MKIDEYYRSIAKLNLNGSVAALLPAIFIIGGNLLIFQNKQIMMLTIPFLIYSIINFQLYLARKNQSFSIEKNLRESKRIYKSFFSSEHLVILFMNTLKPELLIFFPDGFLAGFIKINRKKGKRMFGRSRYYSLYDNHDELVCSFRVIGNKLMKIMVYDENDVYIGCLEKNRIASSSKEKKELVDSEGRFVAVVEGPSYYMDEQVTDSYNHEVARLRRGWMPLEWSGYFPESSTPVLSLSKTSSENHKKLQMSFLIHEFFLKR